MHPHRRDVGHVGEGDRFSEAERPEEVVEHGARAFGGQALSPRRGEQPVEQFGFPAVGHLAAAEADQRAASVVAIPHNPKPRSRKFASLVGNDLGGALARDDDVVPEVAAHVAIDP